MNLSKEEKYLRDRDPKLRKVIDKNGHIVFTASKENQFDILVGIVISQFISTAASNSISQKIKNIFKTQFFLPDHFQKLNVFQIKDLGLSFNKAKSIKELSNIFQSNPSLDFSNLDNPSLNKQLLSIFGIGPWSVSMFEIFCLGKLDIFSSKDAGLRLAMNNSGMIKPESNWKDYDKYSDRWTPYKTIASIHLWKTVD